MRNDNTTAACPVRTDTFTRPVGSVTARPPAAKPPGAPATPRPATVVPARTRRCDITVYQCTECETRYLGQQYCHDCHQPCVRVDLGGLCPTYKSRVQTHHTAAERKPRRGPRQDARRAPADRVPAGRIIRNLAQILKAEQEPDAACQPIARATIGQQLLGQGGVKCIESSSGMSGVCHGRRTLAGGDRTLTSPFHERPCISGAPCTLTGRQLQSWNGREMSE